MAEKNVTKGWFGYSLVCSCQQCKNLGERRQTGGKLFLTKILFIHLISVFSINFISYSQDLFPLTMKHYSTFQVERIDIINDSTFVRSFGLYSNKSSFTFSPEEINIDIELKEPSYVISDSLIFFEKIYFIDTFFFSNASVGYFFKGRTYFLFSKQEIKAKDTFFRYIDILGIKNRTSKVFNLDYYQYIPLDIEYDSTNNDFVIFCKYQSLQKILDSNDYNLFKEDKLEIIPKNDKIYESTFFYFSIFDGFIHIYDKCQLNKDNYIKISENVSIIRNCDYVIDIFDETDVDLNADRY